MENIPPAAASPRTTAASSDAAGGMGSFAACTRAPAAASSMQAQRQSVDSVSPSSSAAATCPSSSSSSAESAPSSSAVSGEAGRDSPDLAAPEQHCQEGREQVIGTEGALQRARWSTPEANSGSAVQQQAASGAPTQATPPQEPRGFFAGMRFGSGGGDAASDGSGSGSGSRVFGARAWSGAAEQKAAQQLEAQHHHQPQPLRRDQNLPQAQTAPVQRFQSMPPAPVTAPVPADVREDRVRGTNGTSSADIRPQRASPFLSFVTNRGQRTPTPEETPQHAGSPTWRLQWGEAPADVNTVATHADAPQEHDRTAHRNAHPLMVENAGVTPFRSTLEAGDASGESSTASSVATAATSVSLRAQTPVTQERDKGNSNNGDPRGAAERTRGAEHSNAMGLANARNEGQRAADCEEMQDNLNGQRSRTARYNRARALPDTVVRFGSGSNPETASMPLAPSFQTPFISHLSAMHPASSAQPAATSALSDSPAASSSSSSSSSVADALSERAYPAGSAPLPSAARSVQDVSAASEAPMLDDRTPTGAAVAARLSFRSTTPSEGTRTLAADRSEAPQQSGQSAEESTARAHESQSVPQDTAENVEQEELRIRQLAQQGKEYARSWKSKHTQHQMELAVQQSRLLQEDKCISTQRQLLELADGLRDLEERCAALHGQGHQDTMRVVHALLARCERAAGPSNAASVVVEDGESDGNGDVDDDSDGDKNDPMKEASADAADKRHTHAQEGVGSSSDTASALS